MGKKNKRSNVIQKTNGVMDYLQHVVSRDALLQLYQEQNRGKYICRAVLQRLSQISQQVVVRLATCGGSFSSNGIQIWIIGGSKMYIKILHELNKWAIIIPPNNNNAKEEEYDDEMKTNNNDIISLTPEFAKGLQETLLSADSSSPWKALTVQQIQQLEQEANEKPNAAATNISFEDLERYTQTQWDAVLHFLVGTPNLKVQPSPAVIHFLLQTGLMQSDPEYIGSNPDENAPLVITTNGYDFMLQDTTQQVWHFVVQYLQSLESHTIVKKNKKKNKDNNNPEQEKSLQQQQKNLALEALLLLVCLGFTQLGEAYLASTLTKDSRVMISDLALFGLLYVRKIGKQTIFYPTRIAMQLIGIQSDNTNSNSGNSMWALSSKALTNSLANPTPKDSSHLAIIVQTNFQVCAYTTSELHVSMLGLFCDVQTIRYVCCGYILV